MTHTEVNKVIEATLDAIGYDKEKLNKLSLIESCEFYNQIYKSVGIS